MKKGTAEYEAHVERVMQNGWSRQEVEQMIEDARPKNVNEEMRLARGARYWRSYSRYTR